MNLLPKMLLVAPPPSEWMKALDDNAPAVAIACTVVLLLALVAITILVGRRRDLAVIHQTEGDFLYALQNSQHVLSVYQDRRTFTGSPRSQIYLAACRELCFYLLGTDQVEKNFPTRLRAAGRIAPPQMAAVARAMRLAVAESSIALDTLSPGAFLCGIPLPFVGLLGSLAVVLSIIIRSAPHEPDYLHMLVPAAVPFVLSLIALFILLPLGSGLCRRLKGHQAQVQLFPLYLANQLERAFVDHRQSMAELPSVAGLGAPHIPSLSLPPTDQSSRPSV